MMFFIIPFVLGTAASAVVQPETFNQSAINFDGPVQRTQPMIRDLPADVLRDFPGLCFASTQCKVFNISDSWSLSPFCGAATCVLSPEGFLVERVQDCGILPKPNPKCKIVNEDQRSEIFPKCCPIFQCVQGVTLEYPTVEELQSGVNLTTLETTVDDGNN